MQDYLRTDSVLKYITINVVITALYFATGYFGVSLIATARYATPIWIPSGLALGVVLIWGLRTLPSIFIASFALNFYISVHPALYYGYSTPLFIASIIATGAVLQATVGWALIKKWVGLHNPLNYPVDILMFALLSGPIACLVNTSWSNTGLFILHILSKQQYLHTWTTWWIGDSIGALTMTPLVLIFFAKPRSLWRSRIIPILIPLCISFIAVIVLYVVANKSVMENQISLVLIVGLLFCVLINIALFIIQGQKNILQKLIKTQSKALKLAEAKNLLILRSAGEGIFGVDNDGKITFINPAAAKMLGYEENELLGKSIQSLAQFIHPETQSSIYAAIKSNLVIQDRNDVFMRKDGSIFSVEYISSPLIDRDINVGAVIVFDDITQQREMEFALEKMAHYDSLTGLPNRVSFLEKLTKAITSAIAHQRIIAICFIDIDNFKQINDGLGHIVGDEILKVIPKLLKPELTKMDYLARLGGDEFAIILENVISFDSVKLTLRRFIDRVNKSIKIDKHEIITSLSIGVATYPIAGNTANELIKNADIAMYKAKELGKNTFTFFDEEISKQVQRINEIEAEMHYALKRNEFSAVYQPIIDVKTLQLLGFEVLIRWNNATFGEISPHEFVPLAEKNGLIHKIGAWILKEACMSYHTIQSILQLPDLLLSINVSVMQLENEKFLSEVKNILSESGMNSNNLLFEITETGMMKDPISTIKLMHDVKKLGIRFALDDFGISYSSMQYLKNLPVSLLKIDQVFINDLTSDKDDLSIVKAIIQLAHTLGISTIAEGVEIKDQIEILKELNCEYMQGEYFSAPMSLERIRQVKHMFYQK